VESAIQRLGLRTTNNPSWAALRALRQLGCGDVTPEIIMELVGLTSPFGMGTGVPLPCVRIANGAINAPPATDTDPPIALVTLKLSRPAYLYLRTQNNCLGLQFLDRMQDKCCRLRPRS
jgi:hypothetical protein